MQTLVTILHVIICLIMILVVLLQAGKGASMGAVFGGSSQTVFGSGGPGSFLSRMTTGVAIVFMLTSFSLSYIVSHKGSSLMENAVKPAASQTAPAPVPALPAQPPATAQIPQTAPASK